jgi:hypothetical protein
LNPRPPEPHACARLVLDRYSRKRQRFAAPSWGSDASAVCAGSADDSPPIPHPFPEASVGRITGPVSSGRCPGALRSALRPLIELVSRAGTGLAADRGLVPTVRIEAPRGVLAAPNGSATDRLPCVRGATGQVDEAEPGRVETCSTTPTSPPTTSWDSSRPACRERGTSTCFVFWRNAPPVRGRRRYSTWRCEAPAMTYLPERLRRCLSRLSTASRRSIATWHSFYPRE